MVGATSIQAFAPATGTSKTVAGPWKDPIEFRTFGGFNPEGSTIIHDSGGPYELRLFAMDIAKSNVSAIKAHYMESIQEMDLG